MHSGAERVSGHDVWSKKRGIKDEGAEMELGEREKTEVRFKGMTVLHRRSCRLRLCGRIHVFTALRLKTYMQVQLATRGAVSRASGSSGAAIWRGCSSIFCSRWSQHVNMHWIKANVPVLPLVQHQNDIARLLCCVWHSEEQIFGRISWFPVTHGMFLFEPLSSCQDRHLKGGRGLNLRGHAMMNHMAETQKRFPPTQHVFFFWLLPFSVKYWIILAFHNLPLQMKCWNHEQ